MHLVLDPHRSINLKGFSQDHILVHAFVGGQDEVVSLSRVDDERFRSNLFEIVTVSGLDPDSVTLNRDTEGIDGPCGDDPEAVLLALFDLNDVKRGLVLDLWRRGSPVVKASAPVYEAGVELEAAEFGTVKRLRGAQLLLLNQSNNQSVNQ